MNGSTERVFALALFALTIAATIGYTVTQSSSLPATIPVHYGVDNRPNGYGPRSVLYFPVLITCVVVTLLALARRLPVEQMKLGVRVTSANRERVERAAQRFFTYESLAVAVLAFLLTKVMVESARAGAFIGGQYLIVLGLALVVGPIAVLWLNLSSSRS